MPPPPVALPELPSPFTPDEAEGVKVCVPRFGNAGCAAHLYAQLLCAVVGETSSILDLKAQLDRQFSEAGIDFQGLSPAQIESEALQDQVPSICPGKGRQILELFSTLNPPGSR